LISIEITQINEKDTTIFIEDLFTRYVVENARGSMTLIIAPDQFAYGITFWLKNGNKETILTNIYEPWSDLSSPGIREYSYDFYPEKMDCYYFYLSDNLNRGYGEGYFKLLAEDGTVLLYNDGKNCKYLYSYINVTEPIRVQNFQNENSISIFPNPAYTQFTVTNTENAVITMYNLVGQQVKQVAGKAENTIIQTEDLPAGMYVLKVEKENGLLTKKVQVVR
jgi:hypothetical protein